MSVILAVGADTQIADLGALGAAGDLIYIRATEPFWGVFFEFQATHLGTALPFQTLEYSAGSGSWPSITAKDSTVAFTSDGCIALLPTTDIFADGSWVQDTVDGVTGYWIRLDPDALLTNVKVSNVSICPYRPPLDSALFPQSGFALASVLPKILVGTWRGETIVWDDVWTLEAARVMQLVVARTRGPNSAGALTLWAICQDDIYHMPIGPESDPARATWLPTAGTPHILVFMGTDFELAGHVKTVQEFIVRGQFLQGSESDQLFVYHRWDNDDRWHRNGPFASFPISLDLTGRGDILYTAVALDDNQRSAVTPYIQWAGVPADGWTDEGTVEQVIQSEITSPQSV